MSIDTEFATVEILLAYDADTRRVDAFALALIKAERQMRKLTHAVGDPLVVTGGWATPNTPESVGDGRTARAHDQVVDRVNEPLYGSRSSHRELALLIIHQGIPTLRNGGVRIFFGRAESSVMKEAAKGARLGEERDEFRAPQLGPVNESAEQTLWISRAQVEGARDYSEALRSQHEQRELGWRRPHIKARRPLYDGPRMLGETIGHYRLTDRLGAGAMGEVYLAEDTRLHRSVALKMLPAEARGDEAAAARLVREARVASALTHPNIAVIYEMGEVEREGRRHGFIAMEYVPGLTLAEIAGERRLDVGEILDVARQVADALAAAHSRGVMHGDIKPGNVMVTDRGVVKVLDFGLARYAPGAEETATWSGPHRLLEAQVGMMGTLAYMSPEQARGGELDERSDVFSLGVLIYELLEGRRPFVGQNAVELVDTILREPPPPLVRHEGPLARELGRAVLRMLEKDRERRHADMDAVCRDLAALLAGRGLATGPATTDAPSIAILSFTNITRSREDDWLGTGIAETVTAGLSALPGLSVVSRARVVEILRKLGGPQGPEGNEEALAARLGRELGVELVVTGGYQRLDEQVRVTARVTDLTTGKAVQTVKLDGRMAGIFDLQDRILDELSQGLRLHLPSSAAKDRDLYETHSVEAYEAFAKGLINLRAESPEALDRAILFFERSVALDPDYASAHAQRGIAYELKADYLSMPELYERALASLDRALILRPRFVDGHRARASVLLALGREDEAVTAVEHALALDPGAASAYQTLGRVYFIGCGDFARAAEYYEKTLALNPQAGWAALQLAHCAALLGDLTRAEAAAWRAVVLQEEFLSGREGQLIVGAYVRLGQAFALQGRHAEALHQFERELEFLHRVDHALRSRIFIELHQRIGEARTRLGDAAGGRAALDLAIEAFERRVRTGADDPFTRYYAACAYALRGEDEAALESLEKAASSRRRLTVARAQVEPALESLREQERFRALVSPRPPPLPSQA